MSFSYRMFTSMLLEEELSVTVGMKTNPTIGFMVARRFGEIDKVIIVYWLRNPMLAL